MWQTEHFVHLFDAYFPLWEQRQHICFPKSDFELFSLSEEIQGCSNQFLLEDNGKYTPFQEVKSWRCYMSSYYCSIFLEELNILSIRTYFIFKLLIKVYTDLWQKRFWATEERKGLHIKSPQLFLLELLTRSDTLDSFIWADSFSFQIWETQDKTMI